MVESKINLTYDSLFEIVLREKNREELQKLGSSFVADLVGYLRDKKALVEAKNSSGVVDEGLVKQFGNVRLLVRDLYECRERKIVRMALISSKSEGDIVDVSLFLPEERLFFDSCVEVFDGFRSKFFDRVVSGRAPDLNVPSVSENEEEKEEVADSFPVKKSVRFLVDTEAVVDSELKSYGPFKVSDVVSVPVDLADVLVSNGKAEVV